MAPAGNERSGVSFVPGRPWEVFVRVDPDDHDGVGGRFSGDPDGTSRADTMRQVASGLFAKLSESVEAMIHDQKAAGADVIADVAKAANHAADDLDRSTPDAARMIRNTAAGIEKVATNLRSDDLGQLFRSLRDFGRAQPIAFIGGAVLGGFIISRSVRSGRFSAALRETAQRAAQSGRGHGDV
jgi:hypothetical protein